MSQTLGQRLRVLRKQRGLILADVAIATGLSISHINDLEHDRSNPSLSSLVRLSVAFDLAVVDILKDLAPYDTRQDA